MWHRFGESLRQAVLTAHDLSAGRELGTRSLLGGLLLTADSPGVRMLARMGVSAGAIWAAWEQSVPCEKAGTVLEPGLTREARRVTDKMYELAVALGDNSLGTEHLLLALAHYPDCEGGRVLFGLRLTPERVGLALMQEQEGRTTLPAGVAFPGLRTRKLKVGAKNAKTRAKQLAFAVTHYNKPFMPYLLFRKRTTDNPYPFFAGLRKTPFYFDDLINQWVVSGYADVVAVLQEPRFSHQQFTLATWGIHALPELIQREFRSINGSLSRQMLFLDPPRQTRLRGLVSKQFTPRVIENMRTQIQQVTDELLDKAQAKGTMDVIADLAFSLPATVIARLLGFEADDNAQFKKWSDDFIAYIGGNTTLAQDWETRRSLAELTEYFAAEIPKRRAQPTDDLLSLLAQAEVDGDHLTDEEIVANSLLILAAGHETTTQLIGNGLLALFQNPSQLALLKSDPSLINSAIEELLRYDSPVQWTSRATAEAFTWQGHEFQAGQEINIALAAANRDPSQFDNPDTLDITRTPNRHLAFGYGNHFCLGAALARMEGQIALGTLLRRFPHLRWEGRHVEWQGNFTFRALKALPVVLR